MKRQIKLTESQLEKAILKSAIRFIKEGHNFDEGDFEDAMDDIHWQEDLEKNNYSERNIDVAVVRVDGSKFCIYSIDGEKLVDNIGPLKDVFTYTLNIKINEEGETVDDEWQGSGKYTLADNTVQAFNIRTNIKDKSPEYLANLFINKTYVAFVLKKYGVHCTSKDLNIEK